MSGRDGGTVTIPTLLCFSSCFCVISPSPSVFSLFLSPSLPLVQYEEKKLLLPFYEGVKLSLQRVNNFSVSGARGL